MSNNTSQNHSGQGDNIGRDKNVTNITLPNKSQLRTTIDKIFSSKSNFTPKPLGESITPETKIYNNQLSKKWINIVNNIATIYHEIEDCCNKSDSSWYDSNALIQLLSLDYQNDYKEQFKNKELSADEVLDGIVDFYIQSFRQKGCDEYHDRHVMPIIVAYTFIECGILEKP